MLQRRNVMDNIASLVATINKIAIEKDPSRAASHVRDLVSGVQKIGHRIAELEKRVETLEKKTGR